MQPRRFWQEHGGLLLASVALVIVLGYTLLRPSEVDPGRIQRLEGGSQISLPTLLGLAVVLFAVYRSLTNALAVAICAVAVVYRFFLA